jgi:hypothetical protein
MKLLIVTLFINIRNKVNGPSLLFSNSLHSFSFLDHPLYLWILFVFLPLVLGMEPQGLAHVRQVLYH